jgi:subtilase family serine protease
VAARVLDTVDDTNRSMLRGNVHPMARPEFDRGTVADAQPLTRILLLLQRSAEQEAALRQLMEEQQSKNSANYHAWLTPENFGKEFGPADSDVQAVTDWLNSHGFQNIKVAKGKTVVEFSGNVGQVRNAFGTEIRNFNVRGEDHFANVSDPQIPAALAPVVRGVVALHNFRPQPQVHSLGTFQRNAKTGEVKPAFTFTDVNGTFYAVGPADFATIYNIPAAATGTGQSIAIVGQSNINLQDVTDFRSIFGLPAYSPGQLNVILNGPDPGLVSGDEGESDLDVEWAGAIAPAATIDFVVTQSSQTDATSGIDGSALYIIDNNIAPILSESYGSCESALGAAGNQFYNNLWQQAAAEGITVVISAGDNGAAGCDNPNGAATSGVAVSGLASTPYNVATGGTDFDDATTQTIFWNAANTSTTPPVLASAKGYIPEITWNDSCAANGITGCAGLSSTAASVNSVAGSGGPSNCATFTAGGACSAGYPKPSWQLGVTPTDGTRDIPDISFFSSDGHNKSFYIVCQADQDITGDTGCSLTKFTSTSPFHDFQAVGGTSAATPTFAGIIALVNQRVATGGNPTPRQGNVNYVLYGLANTAANVCVSSSTTPPSGCVFNDVVKGNVSVACVGGSPNCSNTSTAANQFGTIATAKGGTTIAFNSGTGYDLATGLGSVNVVNLLTKWTSPSLTGTTSTLTLVGAPPTTIGASATFTGTVTRASGTAIPTGLVLLEDQTTGVTIASVSLPASGAFSITTTLLPAAATPYNLIAHYGGDGTFAASDSTPPLSMTVPKQTPNVVVSWVGATGAITTASQNVAYGSPYILRVDVTNSGGTPCENATSGAVAFVCPTGSVQLFQNAGTPLNDFPTAQTSNATNVARLNDRGFAEDQPIQLAVGSYSISATYTADANSSFNSSANSNTLAVTITKATTTSTVTSSLATVASGGSVTLTANVSSSSNSSVGPSGTVQLMNGSTALGSAMTCTPAGATGPTNASCKATLTTALSEFIPLARPRLRPNVPALPLGLIASLLLVFLALQRRLSVGRRVSYAAAGLLVFACLAAGFAGCSGSSGSGGSKSHTDSITAIYSGDANYSGSTSPAVTVSIQ